MKKLFVSIMMAFAMVFACVKTPLSFPSAKADVNSTPVYDTVYYVSDNDHATTYRQSLLANTQIDPRITNIEVYHQGSRNAEFISAYSEFLGGADPSEEQYLIIELSNGFEEAIDSDQITVLPELFNNTLDDFDDWQVLFICGTDETRWFDPYNNFLQYVDYHINTDMLYVFLSRILYQMEQSDSGNLNNATLIFDSFFSQNANHQGLNSVFFANYFLPYLETEMYVNELPNYISIIDLLVDNEVQIICHDGTSFFDVFTNQSVDNIASVLEDSQQIYAIGSSSTLSYEGETLTWVDLMTELRTFSGKMFPIYVFDFGYTYESDLEDDFYVANDGGSFYSHIVDFLTPDTDVSLYYGWSGACTNTHKHCLVNGIGGWLMDLYDAFGWSVETWAVYTVYPAP